MNDITTKKLEEKISFLENEIELTKQKMNILNEELNETKIIYNNWRESK